jgi:hypothetical protein
VVVLDEGVKLAQETVISSRLASESCSGSGAEILSFGDSDSTVSSLPKLEFPAPLHAIGLGVSGEG